MIALVLLLILPNSFDLLRAIGLLTVPYVTVAVLAWQKYPSLLIPSFLLGFYGTASEINKLDDWLRWKGIGPPNRRRLVDYVWELSLKSVGVILILGAAPVFVYFLVVGISKIYAIIGIVLFGVPLLGTALYVVRMNHRFGYGVSELCFAVLLAGFTIEQSFNSWTINIADFFTRPNLLARVLALSTSIYIVVRGWDNIGERRVNVLRSLGKEQLRTVWATLVEHLRRKRSDNEQQ
ncbi:MAG TPA: hypothetical protein VHQ64_02575 [Pyrinomonadaceae bacterium]|nr:hypothetical protein [Pyrinomonadaceae bacterium]